MRRLAAILCLLTCLVLSSALAAQDDAKARPKYDPVALFKRLDANGDGKLSKDEFMKLMQLSPGLKDKPDAAAALFTALDTNKDGVLSLEEFKKIVERGGKQPPPKKEVAKKTPAPVTETPTSPEAVAFFEKKIRPVLVDKCYQCHSEKAEKLRGNLFLDTREGTRKGGDLGPSVVPGNLKDSLLIEAINHKSEHLKMPPKQKLPDDVIADFEKWVYMGAPDPRDGAAKIVRHDIDIEKGRQWWAFQAPKKTPPPAVKDAAWPRSEIDRFLLAGLEAKGLTPVGDAERHTLLRRVYFDLIGLPPAPEEVEAFLQDTSANALEKVVDKLLASPRFGERWGRHWLDVARFAESSGKAANFAYPHAWRYRDYVIAAFNADKPFDQFIREQLAGDLLPAKDDKQKADQLVATGFLAIGSKNHNERLPLQFQMDLVDEQIDATSVAFLGMTVACARCHDHKFDPIPTKDYYALAGIFRSTTTCYGTIRTVQCNHPSPLVSLPKDAGVSAGLPPLTKEARTQIEKQAAEFREDYKKQGSAGVISVAGAIIRLRFQNLESRFSLYEADGTPKLLAMGVRETRLPEDSKLYVRGELDQPGEKIKRGIPQVMTTKQPTIGKGSGRLELANWIASSENPLTARVMANRVWLHLFGRGLVATPDNFGTTGQKPSNPELLNYLAVSFAENGWSVKKLIRTIVLSRAYQQSTEFVAKNDEIDPDNALIWRSSRRRLEAEALRDAMLAVSGKLSLTAPMGSPITPNGEGTVLISFRVRPVDTFSKEAYRSVYLPIVRDLLPESMSLFDFPDPTLIAGERAVTTVPAQSLYLMNNPFVISQAETVAEKLLATGDNDAERLTRAYKLFLCRPPTERESSSALQFVSQYEKAAAAEKVKPAKTRQAAWSALCQSLFASTEFSQR